MILFQISKFALASYNMSPLCWSKNAPSPTVYYLSPPLSPPRGQRSVMMRVANTFVRLPFIGYQAYMKIPKTVRPPHLLLLVLLLLLVALTTLLCVLLVLLVLLTTVTTAITLLLLILLPPRTLDTVVLPIRISATQFLAQVTRNYLPSPIQTLFSVLSGILQSLFNRGESVVAQAVPNTAPPLSVVVTPPCPPAPPPLPLVSAQPRTLRRSKSWFRW
ncbi:hypothetical protein B0F90DRAFT_1376749 [Multifurca ochricompacta]|uniref:Uncharacterized protein n=1 Tax=Multifurca ochricompacta TaxID=376703 RepID=A0AAD4M6K7_9AGAM|nr:hypothetical protein B0F90DRAFT_1376749 [Multifurca ochricompacta]